MSARRCQIAFGMKSHIGADPSLALVHTVVVTAANVNDVKIAKPQLRGEKTNIFGDADYRGAHKRPAARVPPSMWRCGRASESV